MKKAISISAMCLMALTIAATISCSDNANVTSGGGNPPGKYVDLGLPSGTKWKTSNEKNAAGAEYAFFTYDEAVAQFGDKLPSREQCMELVNECEWSWTGMGYKVVGPSGKSISLPAAGYRGCKWGVYDVGSHGFYWSSTLNGSDYAWNLQCNSGSVSINSHNRCYGRSVRLVQN